MISSLLEIIIDLTGAQVTFTGPADNLSGFYGFGGHLDHEGQGEATINETANEVASGVAMYGVTIT